MKNNTQFSGIDIQSLKRPLGYFIGFVILILLFGGFSSIVFSVEPEGRAVIRRFGKVVGIQEPGLHFKLPFGIDTATFVPTERVLKEEFGFRTLGSKAPQHSSYAKTPQLEEESLMLSGDLNVIDVEWVVQYKINDPVKYLFSVRDPTDTLRDVSESVLRRIVGNKLGADVLTVGRVAIADETLQDMRTILNSYDMGVTVERVELQDVTPPDKVKPAFNEVNEARQMRERLVNEAEKKRNQIIPRARGEADEIIAQAEAYRLERTNAARGEAARFTSLLSAYRESPEVTGRRLYLEMIDLVLPQLGRVVVMEAGGTAPLPLLNLGETNLKGVKQ